MDLLAESRCFHCDKVFCCPEHRRSHEILSHPGKYKKKMIGRPLERKVQGESYALEMRRIIYSEQQRSNFHKSRKRKYLTVSRIVQEREAIEVNMVSRKILVPRRKNNEITEFKTSDGTEACEEVETEIISPIEEKRIKDPAIFTTSTPIQKRGANFLSSFSPQISCQFSAPLGSITEGLPGILSVRQKDGVQITSTYQKRVTFSESVESLYNTATEITLPESKPGILASVANAFQSAIQRIPGIGQLGEDSFAIPCSPGGTKRKRATREQRGRFAITGRRPLHRTWSSPPE